MSLRSTVAAAALTAFRSVGDLVEQAVYHRVTPGVYDPSTDAQTDTAVLINIIGVLAREKSREDETKTQITRTHFIVPSLLLGTVEPTLFDFIVIGGVRYEINDIKQVPGKAIYTFFVRAT